MNLEIKNKVILVTGSSRGVGLGISKVLLNEGCKVIINGRNKSTLNKTIDNLKKSFEENILEFNGDVNEPSSIDSLIKKILNKWGRIDGIVLNAGSQRSVDNLNLTKEDWDWYFQNNFFTAFTSLQKMIPYISKTKGSVVTIGSIAGMEDLAAPIPYAVTKSALLSYTKTLARELSEKNIRVNMVSPGNIFFDGGNWHQKYKKNAKNIKNMLENKVPLNCFGDPEDIGNVVAFLISKKAKFITAANFVVDGGQTTSLS